MDPFATDFDHGSGSRLLETGIRGRRLSVFVCVSSIESGEVDFGFAV